MPSKRTGTDAQGDRLGALPDDVLSLVLSFLPAEDAVRTCVLARRWLNLWKSATGLHIDRELDGPESMKALRNFMEHLLLLRGGSPLDTVTLHLEFWDADNEDYMARVRLWIRHFLTCRVRVLTLDIFSCHNWAGLGGLTLISTHLRKLHLLGIPCEDKFLDFSCCPALKVLVIETCNFTRASTISSQSLRRLRIIDDCMFAEDSRLHIHTPNLRSLRLEVNYNRAPRLTGMPFLMEAFVAILYDSSDVCDCSARSGECEPDDCYGCYGVEGDTDNCVLLQGLSEARDLVLISQVDACIFKRDLKWYPVFRNLKTLVLDEYWCVPNDFNALMYMLEHSPILEKLTLELYCTEPKCKVKTLKGRPDPTERSAALPEHLRIVEIKYEVTLDKVLDVLEFLGKLGIYFRFLRN